MKLRSIAWFAWLMGVVLLIGCTSEMVSQPPSSPPGSSQIVALEELRIVSGQTVYVPAYSEIYFGNERTLDLAITLSVRNTDFNHPIILTSVRYYDTHGQLVREYLPQPNRLGPMASTDFFVAEHDDTGGTGANFIVEWVAEEPVYEPVIEALMLTTVTNQGISFISPGRVISQTTSASDK
jgi:hypothetical protein